MLTEHAIRCPLCPHRVKDETAFTEHFRVCHYFACKRCGKVFVEKKDLNEHMDTQHNHKCLECKADFETSSLLEVHINDIHKSICPVCNKSLKNTTELKEHIKSIHTFECRMCDFEGTTEILMENHILNRHCNPDENNQFSCDECEYKCENREDLIGHYRRIHKEDTEKQVNEAPNSREEERLKNELRILKSNFQRLEQLFHNSVEEVNKVKSEYESKIMEANDRFRVIKAENEELKEKVDVLFKLGRSYINRKETANKEKPELEKKKGVNDDNKIKEAEKDDIQVVEEISVEDLGVWTKNKLRGFKRASPAAAPLKNLSDNPSASRSRASPTPKTPRTPLISPSATPGSSPTQTPSRGQDITRTEHSPRYCHYFVNYGKCNFEERTGQKCRFQHRQAPMCTSGTRCTRHKCMFNHPKLSENNQRNHFLGQMIPPWNIMSPWMNQAQNVWNVPQHWNNRIQPNH